VTYFRETWDGILEFLYHIAIPSTKERKGTYKEKKNGQGKKEGKENAKENTKIGNILRKKSSNRNHGTKQSKVN
jgi:hypothetical protein